MSYFLGPFSRQSENKICLAKKRFNLTGKKYTFRPFCKFQIGLVHFQQVKNVEMRTITVS